MTSIKRIFTLAMVAVSLIFTTTASQAESTMEKIVKSGELTIAVQTQGPPVSFVDQNGKRTGLVIEIMEMMAEDMGVTLIVQDYDWKGLIPALSSGKADIIAADMTPTAKRHMQVIFTDPVFFAENIAFSTKEKGFKHWTELNKAGVTVGATQASTYADAVKKFIPEATLKEYSGGTAQTSQALISGRIDAAITDKAAVAQYLSANSDLVLLDGTLTKEPLGFAVRPDSIHLLHALNNYVTLIRHDGRLQKLLTYWWESSAWEADHK